MRDFAGKEDFDDKCNVLKGTFGIMTEFTFVLTLGSPLIVCVKGFYQNKKEFLKERILEHNVSFQLP